MSEKTMPTAGKAEAVLDWHPETNDLCEARVCVDGITVYDVTCPTTHDDAGMDAEIVANTELGAAAFNSAHQAAQQGYDPLEAVKALPELLEACTAWAEVEDADTEYTENEPDDAAVGWDGHGKPLPLTFGHVRNIKRALARAAGKGGE